MKRLQPNHIWRVLIISVFISFLALESFAQTMTLKGRVVDESGGPLVGATVKVKTGPAAGTLTNANGEFSLPVAPSTTEISISFTGYTTLTLPVRSGSPNLGQIRLSTLNDLDEVVVVGFGTQKKSDMTGSVATVNLEALRDQPNTNIGQYLQGTVPGLNVGVSTSAGGTPPISVRGRVSLNGNQNVLIILDGIQYNQSLSSINPDDIASISVLKDASSTAVYGAQAANGVILITSRKGMAGDKPRINFSTAYTVQNPTVNLRPNDREGFLEGIRQAYYDRAFLAPGYTTPNPTFNVADFVDASNRVPGSNPAQLLPNDFDWWKEGTNTGLILENNLSISGGNDRVTYLLSGSYLNQKGTIINDIFKRKSVRTNLEAKALPWWKVGLIASGAFVNQDGAEPALGSLQHMSPLLVPFDPAGNLIAFPTNTLEANPFTTYYVENYDRNNYYFANAYTDIDFPFLKGLNYRLNFGNNYRTSERYASSIYGANQTGEASKANESYYDYNLDNILTYSHTFGKHDITATLLYGSIQRKFDSTNARATGFSSLTLGYNNLGLGTNQFTASDAWQESLAYQMARVNYKFNNRYLVTATVRRDGFSGFAKNYKYALFPALGLSWIASEESFIKNITQIDLLKVRATFGVSGNQTGRYSSIPRVNSAAAYIFGDGGTTVFGQSVNTLGNDNLKWERTKEINIGLDFGIIKNRISGSFDFYQKNTSDLLFSVNIPTITGFSNIQSNVGKIRNTGFEANVTGRILDATDFKWSTTLNFSLNRNKIVSLLGVDANGDGVEDDLVSSGLFIGKPITEIFDYQRNGIYQLNDTRLPGFPVGSARIVDQNGDGQITTDDRVFLGNRDPNYRFSMLNNFSYKGFSLTVFINSVQGGNNTYLAGNTPMYYREDNTIRWNELQGVDYWSPTNPGGKYPRNISGAHAKFEPTYYENRSFIRLQDVSLGYNFAGTLLKKIKAQSINVYVSGKNLATWTKWDGWDPEALNTDGIPSGLVNGGRPVMRAFTFGINVTY